MFFSGCPIDEYDKEESIGHSCFEKQISHLNIFRQNDLPWSCRTNVAFLSSDQRIQLFTSENEKRVSNGGSPQNPVAHLFLLRMEKVISGGSEVYSFSPQDS